MTQFLSRSWCDLEWSDWIPLDGSLGDYQRCITTQPGLYRVRIVGREALAYVGQTGRDLRERTRALASHAGRPANDPPWNDPHTAAPGLWAWRVEENLEYEVSVTPLMVSREHRQCMEDRLLFEYRLERGESTLANHGRFHARWRRPSNKKKGHGMRRLPDHKSNEAAEPSLTPPGGSGQPKDVDWLGLPWSETTALEDTRDQAPSMPGVYRLVDGQNVVYLGESNELSARLQSHHRNYRFEALSASWVVMEGAFPHHLREREADLIGAFYKQVGKPPKFQYRVMAGRVKN